MTDSTPLRNRRDFLQVLLCEDLDTLSADLGLSARALSELRGSELARLKTVIGHLPAEDQVLDRDVYERRRAS